MQQFLSFYCRGWSKSTINLSSRPKVNQQVHYGHTHGFPISHHFDMPTGIFTMAVLTDLFEACSFFRPHSKPVFCMYANVHPSQRTYQGYSRTFSV